MGLLVLFGFLRFLFFVSTRARLSIGLTLTITLFVLVLAFGALGLITAILLLVFNMFLPRTVVAITQSQWL